MAANPPPAGPFKVLAANVNGLSARQKRRGFFAFLQEQHCGVALLSETHCTSDSQAKGWVQEGAGPGRPWNGVAVWAHQLHQGQRAAGGVGILVAQRLVAAGTEVEIECSGASGRVLKAAWQTPWGQRMAAVAVYAPCTAQDRTSFFLEEYMDAVTSGTQQFQIVGGDFNCCMHQNDVLPREAAEASRRMVGSTALRTANLLAGLHDAWLQCNPADRPQPTHYAQLGGGHVSGGRLDYVFVSDAIVDQGWLQAAQQHRRFPSDHRPVVVRLQPSGTPSLGPRRWHFPNHMLGHDAFMTKLRQQIQQAADTLRQRTPRLDPSAEWESLKDSARNITQQVQQQMQRQQREEQRRLRQQVAAARRMAQRYQSSLAQQQLLAAEESLSAHLAAETQRKAAATDPLWEVYGEASTFWFHRLGKAEASPQYIAEVRTPDGSMVAAQGAAGVASVGDLLADYYDPAAAGLFSQHPTDAAAQHTMLASLDRVLDDDDRGRCYGPEGDGSVTMAEAAAALRSLPRGKTPGSDGLSYEFYTALWDVVGEYVVAAFNHCFMHGLPLAERQRLGLITLVYKGGGKPRWDPASYRPITLLNADVKLVAKAMVLRLGPVMGKVIDPTQTAFVPGRDIADNVLLHLEAVDYVQQQQGQQGCLAFLDFEKAYDRLDRTWLFKCMAAMGLPDVSVRWVRLLLEGTSGRVLFNGGHLSRSFCIPSGCAQGSPLSPLLYVLAAQPLAARCRQLQREGAADSIAMPDGTPAPPCHQHADDTTLHARTVEGVRVLLNQAVQPFCAASGAKLNASKSQGMTLGGHHPLRGPDPDTGIQFVDTSVDPIRHLGVLLSVSGATAFAERTFQQRLGSMTYRARMWSQHKLTLIGRCEVARQVMASCLAYHAQFVPVPDNLMRLMQRRIKAFTLGLGCIRSDDDRQLVFRPSAPVANLPVSMGGIGHVDVQAHITAMQAKVAAALLHPRRHAWKQFMRANLERQAPGLGCRVLVQRGVSRLPAGLSVRHAAYAKAFQQLGVFRQVPHASMSVHQVRLELVVGNHSVAEATTGLGFRSPACLPACVHPRSAGTTLGQAAAAMSFQAAVDGIVVPAEWQQLLGLPHDAASSEWAVDPQAQWAMQTAAGQQHPSYYRVQHDGSLTLLVGVTEVPAATAWVPACVVIAHATRRSAAMAAPPAVATPSQQPLATAGRATPDMPYLVGKWVDVDVDPSVWCVGPSLPVLRYTVKAATQRLLQIACSSLPGWVPSRGVRPRIWRNKQGALDPAEGLRQLEAGQKRSFEDMVREGFSQQGRFAAGVVAAGVNASWMGPSPPRQHPLQRSRASQDAAAAAPTAARQEQQHLHVAAPTVDDTTDPLVRGREPALPEDALWRAAYARAADKTLPRHLRVMGWKVLHAAVRVGASSFHAARSREQLRQYCCGNPSCVGQLQQQQQIVQSAPSSSATAVSPLETMSHALVGCPPSQGAWAWLQQQWCRLDLGAVTDRGLSCQDPRVVLLDDTSVWKPPAALARMWTHLRLLMLQSVYGARAEQQFSSSQVVGRFLAALQQQLVQDWARRVDIRVDSGVPLSYLRGRSPVLPAAEFAAKWQGAGVVYVVGPAGPQVCLPHLS